MKLDTEDDARDLEDLYKQLRKECMDKVRLCKKELDDINKTHREEMMELGVEAKGFKTLGYFFMVDDALVPYTNKQFDVVLGSPEMAAALSALLPFNYDEPRSWVSSDWCTIAAAYLGVLKKGEADINRERETQLLEQAHRDWVFRNEKEVSNETRHNTI